MTESFARQLAKAFLRTSPALRPASTGSARSLGSRAAQLRAAFFRTSPSLRLGPAAGRVGDTTVPPASQTPEPDAGSWFPLELYSLRAAPVLADLAAAGEPQGTAILAAPLPDGETELVLHRESPQDYVLEVVARPARERPSVLGVRYQTRSGIRILLVAVRGEAALARLPGYLAGKPWAASAPFPVAAVPESVWDPDVTAASIRAVVGGQTRAAWRAIVSEVPRVSEIIENLEEQDGPW